MEKDRVFIVREFYTPYEHNKLTEDTEVTVFNELRFALDFVRGTDGNSKLKKADTRVGLWLKEGAVPMYEIGHNHRGGITFMVNKECISETALKQGGYVYKVTVEPYAINSVLV